MVGLSAEGIAGPNSDPPDTTSAVGTQRFVELINNNYGIYDRSGALLSHGDSSDLFGSAHEFISDPQVTWDPQTNRFYIATFNNRDSTPTGPDEGIAWGFSKTASPSTPADWCTYFNGFGYGKSSFPDYPRLGVTANFLLIGSNVFSTSSGSYVGADVAWLSKPPGGTSCPTATSFKSGVFKNLKNSAGAQLFTPVPTRQTDTTTSGWVVATPASLSGSALSLFEVTRNNTTGNATLTRRSSVAVPAFSVPANAQQGGSTSDGAAAPPIDTLSGKLMQAYSAVDPRFGHSVIWTAHTVFGGAGAEVRWYEIDPSAARLDQSGVISDSSNYYFNATVAPDRAVSAQGSFFGNSMVATTSGSSATTYPQILTVAKGDKRPQTAPVLIHASDGPKLGDVRGTVERWGDYSGASPDPTPGSGDIGRVWISNEWNGAPVADVSTPRSWHAAVSPPRAAPVITPGAVSVVEGNSGTKVVPVPVSLSAASGQTVTASWATVNNTAVAPGDYSSASGTVTFAPGETSKTVAVTVKGDTLNESDELFFVGFSNPTNATIGGFFGRGFVTITNDDPVPKIVPGAVSVVEGNSGTKVVQVPVSLSAASGQTVTASWATVNNTAVAPGDYSSASGTVTFAPGETSKTVAVTVKGDTLNESDELFFVGFSNPTNATIGGFYGRGFVTITNDDA